MKTTYEFQVAATCPVDESVLDIYDVVVTSDQMVEVERILEVARELTLEPIFQEQLTEHLSLRLGLPVRTTGTHSGVRVVSEAP